MRSRLIQLPEAHSFFLFGARNTGKSTLIQHQYSDETSFFVDLLDSEQEVRFISQPGEFYQIIQSLPKHITHVILDEVQKVPKLLDFV